MNPWARHNFGMAKRSDLHAKFCRELAPRLAIALDESGLDRAEIARQLGVSRSAVTQWLDSGKIQAAQIPAFARATGVSVEWLMTGKGGLSPEDRAWLDKLHQLEPQERRRIQAYTDVALVTACEHPADEASNGD